jgi:sugar lactone lactonase YvrE
MAFTEGPVAAADGTVSFTDIPANRIMKWDGKGLSVWRRVAGSGNRRSVAHSVW